MSMTGELHQNQSGFTLVEAMIAVIILGGGLLALASGFSQGMILMSTSHNHQIAKEKASEAVESVFTSRDTRTITWAQIRNAGNGGIFLDGPQSLRAPGADGLVNTADDGALETENQVPLNNFTRETEIRDIAPNLRQIRVIVRYQMGHLNRRYELIAYISSFA